MIDRDGNLVTDSGKQVPRLNETANMFLNRTIAIYGPSGTGKTVITKHIMKLVSPHIQQCIIVAPTEPTNRSYAGFIDSTLIHYTLYKAPRPEDGVKKKDNPKAAAERFLKAIWDRQDMMASIYKRANDIITLAALFNRLPKSERAYWLEHIVSFNDKRELLNKHAKRQFAHDAAKCRQAINGINEKFKEMLMLIYKRAVVDNFGFLENIEDLTDDEQYSLRYVEFNPKLLLIFDDCAAQLKPFFNSDIFRRLFYQNRHSFITVIVCCQDDTDLPANLRKNAFVSFFTDPIVCASNFDRKANQFPKQTKDYVQAVVNNVFSTEIRKFAYIREDPRRKHFYYIEAPLTPPFPFGSKALSELCDTVRSDGTSMDESNPYFGAFKLDGTKSRAT